MFGGNVDPLIENEIYLLAFDVVNNFMISTNQQKTLSSVTQLAFKYLYSNVK